jgi:hypothetical protein
MTSTPIGYDLAYLKGDGVKDPRIAADRPPLLISHASIRMSSAARPTSSSRRRRPAPTIVASSNV